MCIHSSKQALTNAFYLISPTMPRRHWLLSYAKKKWQLTIGNQRIMSLLLILDRAKGALSRALCGLRGVPAWVHQLPTFACEAFFRCIWALIVEISWRIDGGFDRMKWGNPCVALFLKLWGMSPPNVTSDIDYDTIYFLLPKNDNNSVWHSSRLHRDHTTTYQSWMRPIHLYSLWF